MSQQERTEQWMMARRLRNALLATGLLGAAALTACSGVVGTPGTGTDAKARPDSTAAGGDGGTPSVDAGDRPAVVDPPVIVGPTIAESAGTLPMRRLTYREFDHMMARLLGETSPLASGANGWSPDTPNASGFIAPNEIAEYHAGKYAEAADMLVDAALLRAAAGGSTGKFVIPCKPTSAAGEATCAQEFINAFGMQAYRRPVAAAEATDLLAVFSAVRTTEGLSFTESIGAVAKAILQSPNFIYHWEVGPARPVVGSNGLIALGPWQIAARLATVLWEGMPDDELLKAAQNGELATPAQIVAQARRMLADPQAAQSLYSFHMQWLFNSDLRVNDLAEVTAKAGSLLTTAAAQGLQTEFTQFLLSVYGPAGDGTLNTLYTAPYAFVNHDLAAIYGVKGPDTGFAKVNLDPSQRAGIFTQVAFLAGIQDTVADNPIYRGIAIYSKVLCGTISPPPPDVPSVTFKPGGTTRQAYDKHGSSTCALGCHRLFDAPGFAFENFDGVGRYRTMEGTQPVDATGTFASPWTLNDMPGGSTFKFNDAVEMVKQLAVSSEAHACVDRQWARYVLGRMETAVDDGSIQAAYRAGAATAGFSLRDTLISLVSSKAFMYRKPSMGEPL